MGARYPYYILADSRDGQLKEAELSRRDPSEMPTYGNVRQGLVYERVPHITLRDISTTPRSTSSTRNTRRSWSRSGRS